MTLLERNYLGLRQNRISPNKRGFFGALQAVFDGLKLLSKVTLKPLSRFNFYYFLSPFRIFIILFLEWLVSPFFNRFLRFNNRILFLLSLVGILVYFILFSGLFSVRKYSLLGSIRRRRQSISFELVFFFLLFIVINYFKRFSFTPGIIFVFNIGLVFIIFLVVLVELGRTPFDFPESERELVSGYNTEYRRSLFVLVFLREYGFMIFFSCLLRGIFFDFLFIFNYFFIFLILFIRRVFPRTKYDHLIRFFWYLILPFRMWSLLLRSFLF